jgi:lipopolysaccharide export system permease protein
LFKLWRYILWEHIQPFFFAMSVLTLVFLLNLVFRELGRILSRGLGFGLVLEFFVLNMAWIIALAVPMAVLVATLMAFGRLSGDSEIIAMKASGVSIVYIITPVLLMGVLLNFFLIWFNNNVLPDFNHRTRLLATDIARKRPTISLEPGVLYRDLSDYTILVQSIKETEDTSYVKSILIEDYSEPNSSKTIWAKNGKISFNQSMGSLNVLLFDGWIGNLDIQNYEEYMSSDFKKYAINIDVPNMVLRRSESEYRGDREKSASMMRTEVDTNRVQIERHQQNIKKIIDEHFAKYFPNKDLVQELYADQMGVEKPLDIYLERQKKIGIVGKERTIKEHRQLKQRIAGEINIIKNFKRANYVLLVEVYKKYSIPFACIVFVLVGAPLGIMARRGNMAVAGGISFSFFLLYWISLIGGEELADNQFISPLMAMWLANVVVGIGGIYLVVHSIHEATFINWISIGNFFKRFGGGKTL